MKIVSIFNNKGGVGKTTNLYQIAHILVKSFEKTVLLVDLDSQCNLSSYTLSNSKLEESWNTATGNSIWNIISPVFRGTGDIKSNILPTMVSQKYRNLYITPGNISLSDFEDVLGESWTRAIGGDERSIRVQTAFYRYILSAADAIHADIVMLDLGPNLGSINRCALVASDYFIIPMAPDLFSIKGTENLGEKLVKWAREWRQGSSFTQNIDLASPSASPRFLGYITQQYNLRKRSPSGMTRGWSQYRDIIPQSIMENIVRKLSEIESVDRDRDWLLGQIPNLNSLIPYSQRARKPIFDCTRRDGLRGSHITSAKNTRRIFEPIAEKISAILSN